MMSWIQIFKDICGSGSAGIHFLTMPETRTLDLLRLVHVRQCIFLPQQSYTASGNRFLF
jgi:hypothetical protein